MPSWMLFPPGAARPDLDAASPIALLDASFPLTIILHGTADRLFHHRSSIALHQRLLDPGALSDLHLYAGHDHAFDRAPSMTAVTVDATRSFLERMVTHTADTAAEADLYRFPPNRP